MPKWKDITSRRRGETDQTPHVWQCSVGFFRVTVLDSHLHNPGKWVVTCEPFFDARELDATTAEDAKAEALMMVRSYLEQALADLVRG